MDFNDYKQYQSACEEYMMKKVLKEPRDTTPEGARQRMYALGFKKESFHLLRLVDYLFRLPNWAKEEILREIAFERTRATNLDHVMYVQLVNFTLSVIYKDWEWYVDNRGGQWSTMVSELGLNNVPGIKEVK